MPVTDTCRNGACDRAVQWLQVVGQVTRRQVQLRCDHAAADVDTDRRRDDRALGQNDRADGRAVAEVGVRHQRDVAGDERQGGRPFRLREGLLVDVGCPGQDVASDLARCSAVVDHCLGV